MCKGMAVQDSLMLLFFVKFYEVGIMSSAVRGSQTAHVSFFSRNSPGLSHQEFEWDARRNSVSNSVSN